MKKDYLLKVWIVIIGMILFISACSPSRISVEEYNRQMGIETTAEVKPTPTPAKETDLVEDAQPTQPQKSEVPEDLPIMDGAYNLQPMRQGLNVVYNVEGTIPDVVTFYQEVLEDYGWEMAGPSDNALGAMATMLRENTAGDRLAISMQANEFGGFVRLNITLTRTQ